MRVDIGDGVRLWFDVEGLGLVPDGDVMIERPTLVLLHGGPGMDHSILKPAFSAMTDLCQVVYYDHWADPTAENIARFLEVCGPFYTQTAGNPFETKRVIRNREVAQHYMRTERRSVDERPYLHQITNPVLVMAGELDPICPIETSQEIAEALPASLVRFERFADCGHGVFRDNPERAFAVLREFIGT